MPIAGLTDMCLACCMTCLDYWVLLYTSLVCRISWGCAMRFCRLDLCARSTFVCWVLLNVYVCVLDLISWLVGWVLALCYGFA